MTKTMFPSPGHYETRLVQGGPMVSAEIFDNNPDRDDDGELLEDQILTLRLDGRLIDDYDKIEFYFPWLREIGQSDHDYMRDTAIYERAHNPDGALANPHRAIDLHTMKPPFLENDK